jgi:glucosamine-6-phosphate deaminase
LGTFPDFKNIDEVPRFGVTVGPATMVDYSELVIMEIIGSHKHLAFEHITSAKSYQSDWPSTIVRDCTNYLILADVDAAEG